MKNIFFIATLLVASSALATGINESVVCSFTEPFISYTFNPSTNSVVLTNMGEETTTYENATIKKVADVVLYEGYEVNYSYGTWQMQDSMGNALVTFALDFSGSDGMSDQQYPFTGVTGEGTSVGFTLVGGCYSASNPPVDAYGVIDSIGLPN